MILENPALTLNIKVEDILGILEKTLKEKNWKKFELANLKLVYTPIYIFNYDTLVEAEQFAQGFSGVMAMDAISGKLEPLLTKIIEDQPVNYEKKISHELQMEIQKPAITKKEVHDTCRIKLAGQFGLKKEALAVSGFRLVYWPIWRIFVTLPDKIQKVTVEGVSGYPMNFEEVPEREKGWLEVTKDTIDKMKSPKGWVGLSKGAAKLTRREARVAARAAMKKKAESGEGVRTAGAVSWLLHSKYGRYTVLLIIILIVVWLFLGRGTL